jgi:hypothetical protein
MQNETSGVAILVIAFNRPEMFELCLQEISKIKPKKILIAIDGPRKDVEGDLVNVAACKVKIKSIDWDCDIKTHFSQENMGVGLWPKMAIDFAFENVNNLIVIEDDVRIKPNFYDLVNEALIDFSKDERAFAICASNLSDRRQLEKNKPLYKSKYFSGWGWATTREKWSEYQFEPRYISLRKAITKNNFNIPVGLYFWINFMLIKYQKLKAWDYQVNNLIFEKNYYVYQTFENMAINVGTGSDATHTKNLPKMVFGNNVGSVDYFPPEEDISYLNDKQWRRDLLILLAKLIRLKFKKNV